MAAAFIVTTMVGLFWMLRARVTAAACIVFVRSNFHVTQNWDCQVAVSNTVLHESAGPWCKALCYVACLTVRDTEEVREQGACLQTSWYRPRVHIVETT